MSPESTRRIPADMRWKTILKLMLGIIVLTILMKLVTTLIVKHYIRHKIDVEFNEKNNNFTVELEKVRISMIKSELRLEMIRIYSKHEKAGIRDLNGEIGLMKFGGIHIARAIFKKDIEINEVTISDINIQGKIPFPEDSIPAILSPLNIRFGRVLIDKIDLAIENTLSSQVILVKSGFLKIQDLQVEKMDTLSVGIIEQFDVAADELLMVTSDSMYTLKATGFIYSTTSKTLEVNGFSVKPNLPDYDFTAHYKYETDRIEAIFSNIFIYDFFAAGYFRSRSLISSYIEIGKMDIDVFRDNRHEFHHVIKPEFQDIVYNYRGDIRIDSIRLKRGNVMYRQHAEKANEPGSICFNEITALILNISNDTIYKTESGAIEIKAEGLLMKKSRITIEFKAKLFSTDNSFSLNGTLAVLDAERLNPILEKTAGIYLTSGKIDAMNFHLTANSARAIGKMTVLYHGLDIAVKNKRTDDTTAIKERFISYIVNRKVINSNPAPGKEVRVGIIDFERDPEKFIFNYWIKSILSGVKTSLIKSNKK